VEVKCGGNFQPLLRRPLSIHSFSREHKTFALLYEVVGNGTEILSRYFVGEEMDVLGPLGHGFDIDLEKKIHILVGGGIGVAPLFSLASRTARHGFATYVLIGAKTKASIVCENELHKITDQVAVSTDDGSYGKKGLISDLLLDFILNQLSTIDFRLSTIYACGPKAMLKAIAEIAFQKKIDCQVSLDERMACGVGACKGCAVRTKDGYKMVCKDGPVFNAEELLW
jgi:dihydroorotate dehydrogenase electron transfer subunit